MANLRSLELFDNGLTGEIPPELRELANLEVLGLFQNSLTGEIPPELRELTNLEVLGLSFNGLTGEIPPELGNLVSLQLLSLHHNGLTGEIPPELGKLAYLDRLWLHNNDLTGEVPPELGGLANLEELWLAHNPDLFGALPLANLVKLKELVVGGTELCVPDDSATRLRLKSIWRRYVPVCKTQVGTATATATAYIVQAVQSADFPVPLVTGRPGLLRVFVTAPDAGSAPIPSGLATFYQRDGSTHSVRVSPGDGTIPAEAETAEGSLSLSANAEVPGDVLQPGAEMVVVLDPESALDPVLGVPQRIPATGRTSLDVYDMPAFDVTVVPFLWESEPDSSILDVTNGLTAEDSLFEETRRLLPVGPMSVTVHEPVWTSTRDAFALVGQTEAIRVMEGGADYYMSTLRNPTPTDLLGVAYNIPSKAMFSVPDGGTVAHEFGHNMHLWHAPCGGAAGPDPAYPHARGGAGAWGWDRRSGRLVPPAISDLMTYCGSEGVSDYHFANALRWRVRDEVRVGAYYAGPPTRALLLWGGRRHRRCAVPEPGVRVRRQAVAPGRGRRMADRGRGGRRSRALLPALRDGGDGRRRRPLVVRACTCSGLGVGGRSVANRVDGSRRLRGHERRRQPSGGVAAGPGPRAECAAFCATGPGRRPGRNRTPGGRCRNGDWKSR